METQKKIIVFQNLNNNPNQKHVKSYSTFYGAPLNRLNYLKSKGINIEHLHYLNLDDRTAEADSLIKEVFASDRVSFLATVTSLEPLRNKTLQEMLSNFKSFDNTGSQILNGPYNQTLKINIAIEKVIIDQAMVLWEEEKKYQFSNEIFENQIVLVKSISPYGNSCQSQAIGCKVINGILIVGKNAHFIFNHKQVDFSYYFNFNGTKGSNLKVPHNMDVQAFNFHHYNYIGEIEKGNYPIKQAVSVAKTINGNYVVFQNNPRKAIIVTNSGEIIKKDDATFGDARVIRTKIVNLSSYYEAIKVFNKTIASEKEAIDQSYQDRMDEMYEERRGWYVVELPCHQNDFVRGASKRRFTNWRILANSEMEAYNEAVKSAEKKDLFFFEEPTKCQIDFLGIWTDEVELAYM